MAFYRKLTEGWRLTDGILPEDLLEKPCTVYEALREAGRIPDAETGLNALGCEWMAARTWKYLLSFEAPQEDDERLFLELPKANGSGRAYLNGEALGGFAGGAVRLDMTGAVREGENELTIEFDPVQHLRPECREPLPDTGLVCAPVLRTVNFALIDRLEMTSRLAGEGGVICVEMDVAAYTAGKYSFRYAVSLDGETAGQFEFTEKMPAARRRIRHEIHLERVTALQRDRLEETVYGVKLTLERAGVGCDIRHMETAFRRKEKALRRLAVSEWPVSGDAIDRLTELGADGIVLAGRPENALEKNDFLAGLTVAADDARADEAGMLTENEIRTYAGQEICWPPENSLWRLRGGMIPEERKLYDIGADRFARLVRYRQAARIMARAQKQRREKEAFVAQADENFAYFMSDALISKNGALRPAAQALKHAWQLTHAFCELPEDGMAPAGQRIPLRVWALAENLRGAVLTVTAKALTMTGQEIAKASFPVMGGDVRLAGVFEATVPDAGAVIIRTEIADAAGNQLDRTDALLTADGNGLMEALEELDRTNVFLMGGTARCEGGTAAVSAGVCLLPGEESRLPETEWVNG